MQEPRNSCAVTEKMKERDIRVEEAVERMEWKPVSKKQTEGRFQPSSLFGVPRTYSR
jgi:hypothetical protein